MGGREFAASPQKRDVLQRTRLQRQGALPQVLDTLEFWRSDQASFISGTHLIVDGGLTGVALD